MNNHAMIDVEALRLNQPWKAPLMEIGVVIFDGYTSKEVDSLRLLINQNNLPDWAEPEPDTVKWWQEQEYWPELRVALREHGKWPGHALQSMCNFLEKHEVKVVWFAGPQYDQVMLEAYLDHYRIPRPWQFNDVRDLRTIRKQWSEDADRVRSVRTGHHNAVEDCRSQVAVLREIMDNNTMTSWE